MMIHFMIGFREICVLTAALPLLTLLLCFIFAVVFQAEEVHETHCRVNLILTRIKFCVNYTTTIYKKKIIFHKNIGF